MAFWSENKVEIKRSYRWLGFVPLYNIVAESTEQKSGVTIPSFVIKSFTKPTFSVPTNELGGPDPKTGILQLKPGPPKWQPITITAVDVENTKSNVTNILHSWMLRSGYDPSIENFAKASNLLQILGDSTFISISLNQLDANGNIFEKWQLEKPMLQEFNFGDQLDYTNDGLVTVTMKFNIASAKYTLLGEAQSGTGFLNPFS